MTAFPEVQCKAYAEINEVVGPARHSVFLPAGAVLMANAWYYSGAHVDLPTDIACRAMSRDSTACPKPDEFMPERFLTTRSSH